MPISPSEWVPFYQHNIDGQAVSSFGFSDSTIDTSASSNSMLCQTSSCTASDHLAPKGCVSKPIRRRSRASKRTPITLLNANISNFKVLVQQFTGSPSSSISFGTTKGPSNLNFEHGKVHNHPNETSLVESFGNNYYYQQPQLQQQEQQHQQHHVLHQEQHNRVSYDNARNVFLSTSSSPGAYMKILDEFVMDDIF